MSRNDPLTLRHCAVPLLIQVKSKVGRRIASLSLIRVNTSVKAGLKLDFVKEALVVAIAYEFVVIHAAGGIK